MSSLYLHLPYCLYKCHYCDFNSYAAKKENIPFQAYKTAVVNELRWRCEHDVGVNPHLALPLETVFIGGGTPSLFPPDILKIMLEEIFEVTGKCHDITMEANPGTVTEQSLYNFAQQAGVTRLSLGVQSLQDAYLGKYGRIHTAAEALQAIHGIRQAGFRSWSCDLMFGFPGQTLPEWQADLEKIVSYDPPHLSCYAFTVEKEAPYGRQVQMGHAPVPDDDIQADMFDWTKNFLETCGYEAYEISNFAKAGQQSWHNLNYWNYGSYLGLGAGAVSFLHSDYPFVGYRQTGLKTPDQYLKHWLSLANQKTTDVGSLVLTSSKNTPFEVASYEPISVEVAMQEFMMMGLRLKSGVSSSYFKKYFGQDLEVTFAEPIQKARQKGWMYQDGLMLTEAGFHMANQVVGLFMA